MTGMNFDMVPRLGVTVEEFDKDSKTVPRLMLWISALLKQE
jgi:hypothetical protein